jgi:hypothetical protein
LDRFVAAQLEIRIIAGEVAMLGAHLKSAFVSASKTENYFPRRHALLGSLATPQGVEN